MDANNEISQSIALDLKINKYLKRIERYLNWIRKNRTSKNVEVAQDTMYRIVAQFGELKLEKQILLSKMAENNNK